MLPVVYQDGQLFELRIECFAKVRKQDVVEGSWYGYINKKFVKEIKAIYQTIQGLYEVLKDDTFYIDQNLKKKSAWKIKRGQTFHLEEIVTVGKYTRAKVRLNNDIHYCMMRDDYWKLKYKTKVVKIK